jgi:hypothetical protein
VSNWGSEWAISEAKRKVAATVGDPLPCLYTALRIVLEFFIALNWRLLKLDRPIIPRRPSHPQCPLSVARGHHLTNSSKSPTIQTVVSFSLFSAQSCRWWSCGESLGARRPWHCRRGEYAIVGPCSAPPWVRVVVGMRHMAVDQVTEGWDWASMYPFMFLIWSIGSE